MRSIVVVLSFALAACGRDAPREAAPPGRTAFELACAGSATTTSGSVYCVRTDTRTGDVLRIDLTKLPVSNGPTAATTGPPERFHTECVAVNMAERSDFSCVRLNTETGELLLVNLQKVGQLPS